MLGLLTIFGGINFVLFVVTGATGYMTLAAIGFVAFVIDVITMWKITHEDKK